MPAATPAHHRRSILEVGDREQEHLPPSRVKPDRTAFKKSILRPAVPWT